MIEWLRSSGLDMDLDGDFLFKHFLFLLFCHIAADRIVTITTIILSRFRSGFQLGDLFSRHSGFLLITFSFFAFTLFLFCGPFLLLGLNGIIICIYEGVFYTIIINLQLLTEDITFMNFFPFGIALLKIWLGFSFYIITKGL